MNAQKFRSTRDKNGRIVGEIIERLRRPRAFIAALQIAVTVDDEGMERSKG